MNEVAAKLNVLYKINSNIRYTVDGYAIVELTYNDFFMPGDILDSIEIILSDYFRGKITLEYIECYEYGIALKYVCECLRGDTYEEKE